MKKNGRILWGIILIVVGIIVGLNTLGYTNISIFFDGWWTLFIIIPCLINIFRKDNIKSNIIGLIIGVCLLLSCQDVISFMDIIKLLIPIGLVYLGLNLLIKK